MANRRSTDYVQATRPNGQQVGNTTERGGTTIEMRATCCLATDGTPRARARGRGIYTVRELNAYQFVGWDANKLPAAAPREGARATYSLRFCLDVGRHVQRFDHVEQGQDADADRFRIVHR